MKKTLLIIGVLAIACGAANQRSPECVAQINYCMEQCALDPPPSQRQDDNIRTHGNSRTRCEMMCDHCNTPKASDPAPGPNDPIYSNTTTPDVALPALPQEPQLPTP